MMQTMKMMKVIEAMNPEEPDELSTDIRFFGALAAVALIMIDIMM